MYFFGMYIHLRKTDLDLWELFWKGKTRIIARFHRTDLVICNHSGEGKTPSYSVIITLLFQ